MDQLIASKTESPLNARVAHHRSYVYCIIYLICKHGIQAKKNFDELMSCLFTRIRAPLLITSVFDGLKKLRWVVSRFRKSSPQGGHFHFLYCICPESERFN